MDSHLQNPEGEVLHISEEPRREHVLPLDEGGQSFAVSLKGVNVGRFFAFHGILYQENGQRLKALGPTDSWIFGELTLANHGGTWVLTAPPQSPLLLACGKLSPEECLRLTLSEKKAPNEPVDRRQFLTRASLVLILGAGVALGLNEAVDLDALKTQIGAEALEMIRQFHLGLGYPTGF